MLHFYPTPKNRWSNHDFFALLNVPVGVHKRLENLLNCIGIHDSIFCNLYFIIFKIFYKTMIFEKNIKSIRDHVVKIKSFNTSNAY